MCRPGALRSSVSLFLLLIAFGNSYLANAQISGPPTANCHVTDGQFTACPNGKKEWSDVQPLAFPATNSFLYVNQDAGHNFLYLMYDFPNRTVALGSTESVHISFNTVSTDSGAPALEEYDVYIFGNGQFQVLEQGKPTPPGRITAMAGFGTSPNSTTPHVLAEFQVPLTPGPPTAYSPDPLFWGVTVPPNPPQPPPPPPPPPCPTTDDHTYNNCVKAELANAQANAANTAAVLGTAGAACSLFTAEACLPLEAGMLALALVWQIASNEFGRKLALDPPGINFGLPPDPNFTVIAQPVAHSITFPTSGMTPQEAAAFNAFALNAGQLIGIEQAEDIALAREAGASLAGNTVWVNNQKQAALKLAGQAAPLVGNWPTLLANIGSAIQAAGVQFTFAPNDILTFQSLINPSSAASEVQQQFVQAQQLLIQQLGLSTADQQLLVPTILITDPRAAETLGTGVFPSALSDPVIGDSLQQLSTGLTQNAPSTTSLTPSFQITLPGDYVAAGVGLRGGTPPSYGPPPATGPINITGIPSNATIVKAFLYWGMLDNGLETSLLQMNVNGNPVTGTLIGSGPDTCWGRTNSFTFRADVTPLVSGNGTYTLTGFATGGNILQEGASLVVIYQAAGLPLKTVILDDGNISIPTGTSTGTATFSGFTTGAPVTGTTTFMVGDGQFQQGAQTSVSFTGSLGTLSFPNLFAAHDGPLWDTDTFNVSSVIGAGSSTDTATVSLLGDCVLWSAQAFSVTTGPATTPITATAAVVQANANGDTVADLRGLAPGDAPTIQQQIQMVVESETIQNPSISGPALTIELVNGLVTDGIIPPGQASSIETAVLQTLVAPVGPPAISGTVALPAVQASANVEVDVQLSDTGAGNAVATALSQIALKTLTGAGSVTLISPTLPITIGNIAKGASTTVKLFLNIPSTVKRFTITETGGVQDTLGRSYNYSTSQSLFVQ
jgi:hypothetical protein